MKLTSTKIIYWLVAVLSLLISYPQTMLALPEGIKTKLDSFGGAAGYTNDKGDFAYSTAGLAGLIGGMVKILLAFLGVIFLILIIVAGFKWMTTSNPEEIKKIRTKIVNATIGLVIILASYAITYFVLTKLIPAGLNDNLQITE